MSDSVPVPPPVDMTSPSLFACKVPFRRFPGMENHSSAATPDQECYVQDILMYGGFRLAAQLASAFEHGLHQPLRERERKHVGWIQKGICQELNFFVSYLGYARCLGMDIQVPPPIDILATECFDEVRWGMDGLTHLIKEWYWLPYYIAAWLPKNFEFHQCWWATSAHYHGNPDVISSRTLQRCLDHFRERRQTVYNHVRLHDPDFNDNLRDPEALLPRLASPQGEVDVLSRELEKNIRSKIRSLYDPDASGAVHGPLGVTHPVVVTEDGSLTPSVIGPMPVTLKSALDEEEDRDDMSTEKTGGDADDLMDLLDGAPGNVFGEEGEQDEYDYGWEEGGQREYEDPMALLAEAPLSLESSDQSSSDDGEADEDPMRLLASAPMSLLSGGESSDEESEETDEDEDDPMAILEHAPDSLPGTQPATDDDEEEDEDDPMAILNQAPDRLHGTRSAMDDDEEEQCVLSLVRDPSTTSQHVSSSVDGEGDDDFDRPVRRTPLFLPGSESPDGSERSSKYLLSPARTGAIPIGLLSPFHEMGGGQLLRDEVESGRHAINASFNDVGDSLGLDRLKLQEDNDADDEDDSTDDTESINEMRNVIPLDFGDGRGSKGDDARYSLNAKEGEEEGEEEGEYSEEGDEDDEISSHRRSSFSIDGTIYATENEPYVDTD
ncbi:hypothetical protein BJ165DRAFT_1535722 [Panaeolus papilionaceus]|nr:hypothetical protein BJ165DRAFT_1535722 [Panaeolus papilionaceus]